MHSQFTSAVLLGLAAFAVAAPASSGESSSTVSATSVSSSSSSTASSSTSSERFTLIKPASSTTTTSAGSAQSLSTLLSIPISASSGSTGQEPFKFPLANGFPEIKGDSQAVKDLEQEAHGTLSNAGPPPPPHADSLTSLVIVAINEQFEAAFFSQLIYNITHNATGYQWGDVPDRDNTLASLKTILAQEELHEINAQGAVNAFLNATVEPCEYIFPVQHFNESIILASHFTELVLSTLPDIQTRFGIAGDDGLIRGVGAVLGQEGEQDGFFRNLFGKNPTPLPFATQGTREFAFNALFQNFVLPGSCKQATLDLLKPNVTEFGVLNVLTQDITSDKDSVIEFSYQTTTSVHGSQLLAQGQLFLTYLNQVNKPISYLITDAQFDGASESVKFSAPFPGKTNEMNGLTIAAVTNSANFTSPDAVAAATQFGPGLIFIN